MSTLKIYSAEEWLTRDFRTDENQIVVGTPEQPIIRAGTKNVIEAPEKSFKTTFTLRFAAGLASGQTVYAPLLVPKARKILYLHGELGDAEIQERTRDAVAELPRPLTTLFEARDISMHFKQVSGQKAIEDAIKQIEPEIVVFDPYQSFITGLDENGFKDISEALKFIDGLIEKYTITVLLVTHTGKDHSRGTRGHSSLAGWRDTLMKLERDKRSDTVKVTVEPRWAAPLSPFHLKFDQGTLRPTDHFRGQTDEILGHVEKAGGAIDKKILKAKFGSLSREAFRKALERAEKTGAIIRSGNQVKLPESGERTGQPHRVGVCPSGSCAPDKERPETNSEVEDIFALEIKHLPQIRTMDKST